MNLGAGIDCPIPGYVGVDCKTGGTLYPDIVPSQAEWAALGDGYECSLGVGMVDEIRASHVLEHYGFEAVRAVLKRWVEYLKPGGLMKLAVPNFEYIAREYLEGKNIDVQRYVMGGHVDRMDWHGAIFDAESLTEEMRAVGLTNIRPWKTEVADCASLPVSLNLMGEKRRELPKLKIGCAMSVPRLGFQDNFFCWANALAPFNIKPTKYDGAYWDQCLERVAEQEAQGTDYVLCIDYDSVYTRDSVEGLFQLAGEHPELDAIVPLQLLRAGHTPLVSINGSDGKIRQQMKVEDFREPFTMVDTAHFGLSLIKSSTLLALPHPWFLGQPNAAGRWEEGKIDPDISFWKKWRAAGHTIAMANRVVIGHGQFMVSWPGQDMKPIYQNPADFHENGMPQGVWQ